MSGAQSHPSKHAPHPAAHGSKHAHVEDDISLGILPSLVAAKNTWLASWGDVFKGGTFVSDVLAGLTVAAVALPLNVGLAVVSGLPASAGIIAGAVGGILAGIFGGSPLQVTGPAAALTGMVLVIAHDFGPVGVAAACVMVGVLQITLGLLSAGRIGKYVPESVLAGFTTGVGIKLFDQQIPELLGFELSTKSYKLIDMAKMMHQPQWLHHVSWHSVVCGVIVAFMVTKLKPFKRFPAAIAGIGLTTFISVYLGWDVARVGEVPSTLPSPSLPSIPDDKWLDLAALAVPLGLLASVESLLSASAIERMAPNLRKPDPNAELLGQGIANFAVGLFAGQPVTGVPARSGVNVQSGGKTRVAAILHGVLLLVSVLYLSKFIALVPQASLAGLLLVVGARLMEFKELVHLVKTHRIEAAAFIVCVIGTVSGRLVTGLVLGLLLHAVHRYLHRRDEAELRALEENRAKGVRAVLGKTEAGARKPDHWQPRPEHHKWLRNISEGSHRAKTSFVHEQAAVIGRVVMGEHVHIAAGSSVRADEGTPFFLGSNTNLQDGVVVHALKDKHVLVGGEPWAVYVGQNVSIAHDALVHGPCYIGDNTFVGFKAVVHDSVIGSNCFVGIGAVVVGVEIPDGRHVPHGRIVSTADDVENLPMATEVHHEFNEDVVEVNRGLAAAYSRSPDFPDAESEGGPFALTRSPKGSLHAHGGAHGEGPPLLAAREVVHLWKERF
ncbi:MAG: SulP family inorganic anion transporter [Polyangiaceae bacterium]